MLSEDVLEVFKPLSIPASAYERCVSWSYLGCRATAEGVGHSCPFCGHLCLVGEGLASQEKAGVADLLLLNVDGAREIQATPSLEVDDMAFSLSVSTLWGAGTSSAPTRSPCSWSGLGKVVVVPNGHSEGIMQAKVVNKSSSTSDNPNSTSKGKSAL